MTKRNYNQVNANQNREIKEKIISTHFCQSNISQIIKEVCDGGVFYKVLRYSEPKVAIVNLNDLERGKSFICRFCQKRK